LNSSAVLTKWAIPAHAPGNLRAPLRRHGLRPSCAALAAQLLRGLVLAVVGDRLLDLAGCNAHDLDGVADHISWALLALGPVGILQLFSQPIAVRNAHGLDPLEAL
jgi:hypothetical protein